MPRSTRTADRCARWTGVSWAAMGAASNDATPVRAVLVLPNGDLVAGRGFHAPLTNPDDGLARWNGSTWSGIGGGLAGYFPTVPVQVRALALRADGALVVGGAFAAADGDGAQSLAVLSSSCPAVAQSYGTGCASAAGLLTLTADTPPWIASTFRTTTTGVAANSVCLGLIGFMQVSVPLATVLPQGQPGCTLLTTPDVPSVLLPGPEPGTVHTQFAIANDPALLGVAFFQQTLPLEFDLAGALVALRGSNALSLVIGTL